MIPALLYAGALQAKDTPNDTAVTYFVSPGRFGDQILCYLHAKWISYHYGFPLLYKPFLHSEKFALHEKEELWTEEKQACFEQVVTHTKNGSFERPLSGSRLYFIPFFSDLAEDHVLQPNWTTFAVDWKDEGFRKVLRELFAPLKEHSFAGVIQDKSYLTVAVHVRKGGGYDFACAHMVWPLRFPPLSYYVECLYKLSLMCPDRPIYAYVFTDDPNPQKIASELEKRLRGMPITIACRSSEDQKSSAAIEDLFAMMRFDCLIRSLSNFSLLPTLICDYQVVMTPKHSYWLVLENLTVENYIDEIEMLTR